MMSFKDELVDVLQQKGITQAQLARRLNCPKASVSQWCSGKNTPVQARRRELEQALGLEEGYFDLDEEAIAEHSGRIPRLTPGEAARILGVSRDTVVRGLRDGVFPWGYAIHGTGDRWVYFINAKKFAEIERMDYQNE